MRTQPTSADHRTTAHLDEHVTCTCGQELDVCRHDHCPRCGHRLAAPALLFAA